MCQFRSGIILKNRCVVAQGASDSHDALLKELNIEDTVENAMRIFVRVELLPPDGEWWTNPDLWKIRVDQDILPDWYLEDTERYNEEFRAAVKEWWTSHVLADRNVPELSCGCYWLKQCEVERLTNDVTVVKLYDATIQSMRDTATVRYMYGTATVKNMYGNATVRYMYGSATVQDMYDTATVKNMYGNATVQDMYDTATIQNMRDTATVQDMYDTATIQNMRDTATVRYMYGSATVRYMYGNATVRYMYGSATVQDMRGDATVQNMLGNSMAKNHSKGVVYVSKNMTLEMKVHEHNG